MILRRALLGVTAIAAVTTLPAVSATRPSLTHMAPADKYFGRLRLSYLGINNTFSDATRAAGEYTTDDGIPNKVDFAMEALNDWQNQYPRLTPWPVVLLGPIELEENLAQEVPRQSVGLHATARDHLPYDLFRKDGQGRPRPRIHRELLRGSRSLRRQRRFRASGFARQRKVQGRGSPGAVP